MDVGRVHNFGTHGTVTAEDGCNRFLRLQYVPLSTMIEDPMARPRARRHFHGHGRQAARSNVPEYCRAFAPRRADTMKTTPHPNTPYAIFLED